MAKSKYQRQKLFVVNQFYPPDYAPTGQLIHELVEHLGKRGHCIRVFTGQPGYAFNNELASPLQRFHNVIVQRTRATRIWSKRIRGKTVNGLLFFIRTAPHLLKHLQKRDILLLTTAPPFLPILGYLVHLLIGVPYVCILYDVYPDVAQTLGVVSPHHWVVKLWDWLNLLTWNRANKIIVLSQTMKEQILSKHPHLNQKIQIISNWADPNWIVPLDKSKNWFAQEHGLTKKFTILYSGNMGRCHDMDTILKTAKELENEPFQFVFIGGGAKYESSKKTVREWGIDNCLFLPYQERRVLPLSLTACDLSLVSIEEGMCGVVAPSKLYSVLATGRPVAIICDFSCFLPEIVKKIKCGATFANGNSLELAQFIREMANNPELAQSMGEAGRNYLVSHCSLETIAKQYVEALGISARSPKIEPVPSSVPVQVR